LGRGAIGGTLCRMTVEWSENTRVAHLSEDPAFGDDMDALLDEVEDQPSHCVLDLRDVAFLNSSNLAQLVGLRKQLADTGCRVVLCEIQDELWQTFELSGLSRLFDRRESVSLALAELHMNAG
jgi:anti-anti-sigma factor